MPEEIDEMTQAQWDRVANRNVSLVKKAFEFISAGDGPAFLELISDDLEFRMNGTTPFSKKFKGKQAFVELFGDIMQYLGSPIVLTIDNLIPAGDWVVLETSGDAITKEGKPYRNSYCQIFKVKDGKIVHLIEYNDTQLIMDVLFPDK